MHATKPPKGPWPCSRHLLKPARENYWHGMQMQKTHAVYCLLRDIRCIMRFVPCLVVPCVVLYPPPRPPPSPRWFLVLRFTPPRPPGGSLCCGLPRSSPLSPCVCGPPPTPPVFVVS